MTVSRVFSRAQLGMQAPLVTIEVHLSNGLPAFTIVGLPEKAVKESRDRVRSALMSNGFDVPARRITVNLAPADLPKQGGRFDLPIALGLLVAQGKLAKEALTQAEFAGELGLTGEIRPINGALAFALATQQKKRTLFLPEQNQAELDLIQGIDLFLFSDLASLVAHLTGVNIKAPYLPRSMINRHQVKLDMKDVRGHCAAKYALEIAVSGGHHVLMRGSPGCGKSMLAQRVSSIMPNMTRQQALESAVVQSLSQSGFKEKNWSVRPYRAPHHSASVAAMVGGGSPPQPGEISLAHHGVLFMDELPEFPRVVLESLREPLENHHILISRAAQQVMFPAHFLWVSAMNPCPCGYALDKEIECRCTPDQIQRYQSKISGPLLDRIDIRLDIERVPVQRLLYKEKDSESSSALLTRVVTTQEIQWARQKKLNSELNADELMRFCPLNKSSIRLIESAVKHFRLSARSYYRTLRLARTVADHADEKDVVESHIAQALSWR
jgi:magnesium chelatase family protein